MKWMVALKENAQGQEALKLKRQTEEVYMPRGRMSLAQIEAFLFDKDSKFHKQIEQTVTSFSNLQVILKNLNMSLRPQRNAEVEQILSQADFFEMQLWQMLKSVDKMRRDVHNIIEDVAIKEIEKDPVGFLQREARKEQAVDEESSSHSDGLWMNMSDREEEFNINEREEKDSRAQASQSCDNIVPKLLTQRSSPDRDAEKDKQQYLSKSLKPKNLADDSVLNHSLKSNEDVIVSIYKDAYLPS